VAGDITAETKQGSRCANEQSIYSIMSMAKFLMFAPAYQTQHYQCYFHIDRGDIMPFSILDDTRYFQRLIFKKIFSLKYDKTSFSLLVNVCDKFK
jgi:hypothetical protein